MKETRCYLITHFTILSRSVSVSAARRKKSLNVTQLLSCPRPPQQTGCLQNHGSTLWLGGTHTHSSLETMFLITPIPYSLGGMCGAIVTSPFDVVKTRLQSDLFRQKHAGVGAVVGDSVVLVRRPGGVLWHFVETVHIIRLRPIIPLLLSQHSNTPSLPRLPSEKKFKM